LSTSASMDAYTVYGVATARSIGNSATFSGTPHFYSNKRDSGNWTIDAKYAQQEYWNGTLIAVSQTVTTTADTSLVCTTIFDTVGNVYNGSHFQFQAISASSVPGSRATYNYALVSAFSQFSNGYINWTNVINNILFVT
jgi:hypothetical protein